MVRTELRDAAERLEAATETCADPDATERLTGLADQLDTLSTADRGPDHGRLARIQSALDDVEPDVDDETATEMDAANDLINEYRETLEGV